MASLFTLALFSALAVVANGDGHVCQPNSDNQFVFKVDLTSGEAGYYTVDGCDGTSPTLAIVKGVEYELVQNDATNWYHPLGLAYYPDGAHGFGEYAEVPELENPTPDDCAETHFACEPGVDQAPLYCSGAGCETLDTWNTEIGLDYYEPLFQVPEDQWAEQGPYSVKITIPADSLTGELFYFCHIHHGMSGLITVTDAAADANALVVPGSDLSGDYYVAQSAWDVTCGTTGMEEYEDLDAMCAGMEFLCDGATPGMDETFGSCMESIDCAMSHGMRVESNPNPLVVFMQQMIPHHRNAINMAKVALTFSTGAEGYDDEDAALPSLMRNIIAVQNQQINTMQAWLDTHSPTDPVSCDLPSADSSSSRRLLDSSYTGFFAAAAAERVARH